MATIFGTVYSDKIIPTQISWGVSGYPTSYADTIYAYGGNDILDGGNGADVMYGGTGNDTYYINSTFDKIYEYAGEGIDTVVSSVSTSWKWLPNNVENLIVTGSAYYGDGNDLNNFIKGSNLANALYGYSGNDTLDGMGGNDTLDGGNGADVMYGGTGNDIYYVDTMSDTVYEYAGGGLDTVVSSISTNWKWLPINVENLTLIGSAYYGDGNDLNNVITGTNLANSLYGYGGNDKLIGGGGADSLTGGLGADTFSFNYLSDRIDTIRFLLARGR